MNPNPVTITGVSPVSGPEFGLTLVMVGRYVNPSAGVVVTPPAGVWTVIVAVLPRLLAGLTAVIRDYVSTVNEVAGTVPKNRAGHSVMSTGTMIFGTINSYFNQTAADFFPLR